MWYVLCSDCFPWSCWVFADVGISQGCYEQGVFQARCVVHRHLGSGNHLLSPRARSRKRI